MIRQIKTYIYILVIFMSFQVQGFAQTSDKLRTALVEQGFENVRVLHQEGSYTIAFENPVYRWDVAAIRSALQIIVKETENPSFIKLLLLEKDIPRLLVECENSDWQRFGRGELPADSMAARLNVSEITDEAWKIIRNEKPERRNTGKTDLVIYPQFSFENTLKARLYTSQLNIAPALQVSLWRGMHFTGQVIFPLYNQLGYEGDYIRPGQIVLSQEFRKEKLSGKASLGNFSSGRYGTDLSFRYLLASPDWSLKANAGLTGSSHFLDNQWKHSSLNTFTWSVLATWFIPRFNTEAEGGFRRFIYGDTGVYGTLTRWFGETSFGFYAMASKESVNGGFQFCFPFPVKKRPRNHFFRITLPDHQDMVYNAGTEYYYGQTYRVGPETNLVKGFYRAAFVKREILRDEESNQ